MNECSICLDLIDDNITKILICNHKFHKSCIDTWLKQKNMCPLCRTPQNTFFISHNSQFPFTKYKLMIKNNNLVFNSWYKQTNLNFKQIKTIQFSVKNSRQYIYIKYFDDKFIKRELKLKFNNRYLSLNLFNSLRNKLVLNYK